MSYGLSYKGSKNAIAEWVVSYLPPAENLYDLFAGGGAITHAAALTKKYKMIHASDINDVITLFPAAMNGELLHVHRWIGRNTFYAEKDKNPLIRLLWSFSGDQKSYLYGRKKEGLMQAVHYGVMHNDWIMLRQIDPVLADAAEKATVGETDYYNRYLLWRNVTKVVTAESIRHQYIERLHRCDQLKALKIQTRANITFNVASYDTAEIEENSVIYCDIPYRNTNKYLCDFDYDAFYEWTKKQENIVIISSYEMPPEYDCIATKSKRVQLSPTAGRGLKKEEKLWVLKSQLGLYKKLMGEK